MLGDVGTGYGDKERALASGSTLRPTAFPPRLDVTDVNMINSSLFEPSKTGAPPAPHCAHP